MAFPHIKTERMVVRLWNWNSSDNKSIAFDHDSMQSHSLKMYLERYENDLSTFKISNMAVVTEEIMCIYKSLKDPYVMNESMITNDPFIWSAKALPKVRSILLDSVCFRSGFPPKNMRAGGHHYPLYRKNLFLSKPLTKRTSSLARFSGPSSEGFTVSTLWVMLIFDRKVLV